MDRNIPSDQQQQQQQHPQAPMYLQFPPVLGSSSSTEASLLPDTTTSTLSDADRARKRNAQFGQWRTPPQPFFPSVTSVPSVNPPVVANTSAPSVDMTDVSGLDLASLQEAYRRGMAAAAALSKHQMETGQAVFHPTNNNNEIATTMTTAILPDTTNMSTAQSCPNFQRMQQQQQQQQQQNTHNPAIATTAATLPPAYAVPYPATATPRTTSTTTTATTFGSSARLSAVIPAVTRSISLPDMSSNNNKATTTTEEEKRIKRLARNRASARLRRLRKKNLVESYEEQVTVLEQALTKLQSHTWGDETNTNSALLEALSMERGQQPLTAEKRREVVQQILKQQQEQVQNLMDIQMESWMLRWLAEQHSNTRNTTSSSSRMGLEEIQLADELQNVLNLSTEQMEQLKQATEGINEEKEAIETVSLCLEAMMNNGWLVNQEVEDTIEQFCSILNPSQMSKFLLWTDHNSEAIEQLDFVNAPAESSLPANSPNFTFGIDDLMGGGHPDDGEEAKG